MSNVRDEVDLFEAITMLDVPQEVLGKMAEEGKLKSRRADGTVYFLRAEIKSLIDRQVEESRAEADSWSREKKTSTCTSRKGLSQSFIEASTFQVRKCSVWIGTAQLTPSCTRLSSRLPKTIHRRDLRHGTSAL
jgi:hypothetical protein